MRAKHGDGATIARLVLAALVTEEDGSQWAVVAAAGDLSLYAQAGTLRHGLASLTTQ